MSTERSFFSGPIGAAGRARDARGGGKVTGINPCGTSTSTFRGRDRRNPTSARPTRARGASGRPVPVNKFPLELDSIQPDPAPQVRWNWSREGIALELQHPPSRSGRSPIASGIGPASRFLSRRNSRIEDGAHARSVRAPVERRCRRGWSSSQRRATSNEGNRPRKSSFPPHPHREPSPRGRPGALGGSYPPRWNCARGERRPPGRFRIDDSRPVGIPETDCFPRPRRFDEAVSMFLDAVRARSPPPEPEVCC